MITAHLPAGYLLTKSVARLSGWTRWTPHYRRLMAAGLASSVLPDADLLYHYLIDKQQHLHHGYMLHTPAFWAVVSAVLFAIAFTMRAPAVRASVAVFIVNVFGHLVLDSVSAKIAWLYPFTTRRYGLFTVPARHGWWIWNFILHWTFLLEILIWCAAVSLYLLERRRARLLDIVTASCAESPSHWSAAE